MLHIINLLAFQTQILGLTQVKVASVVWMWMNVAKDPRHVIMNAQIHLDHILVLAHLDTDFKREIMLS